MPLPTRYCQHCKGQIKPALVTLRSGKMVFRLDDKFCSDRCKGLSKGGYSKQAYSIKARAFLSTECEVCGWDQKLIVHHIDQDKSHNEKSNIQCLCAPCHDFWHSLNKRIGKPIAGRMPSLIFKDET